MSGRDLNAYDNLFQAAGEEYGIDPALLKAHSFVESGINVGTRASNQGAVGIMQMLPSTARGLGVKDPYDPEQAIRGAAKYIAEGFDATGNAQDAVRYYHGGPDRRIWGPKTNSYVDKVAAAYDRFSREGMTPKQAAAAATAAEPAGNASPVRSASMSPEDLVGLYGAADDKPATSGGGTEPASGALAIRVKPNNVKAAGLSPEDLVKRYGSEEEAPPAPTREAGGMMNAAARGAVEGVPIIGPGMLGAIDRGDAYLRSVTGGRSYEDEARDARAYGRATDEAHPYAKLGGEIAGGAAAMIPLAMTGAGAVALGVRGAQGAEAALTAARLARAGSQTAETAAALRAAQTTNLLTRTTAGGLSGFALGGADTAARDFSNVETDKGLLESVPNRLAAITGAGTLHGALMGGAVGAAAPAVGHAIGATLGPVTNKLATAVADRFSPAARASNKLLEMTSEAGQTIPELRAELARNPNLALADLNPSLQSSIASLAQGGGAEAAAARRFAAARRGAGGDALRSDFDAAIGAAPDPVALRDSLVATAKRNADAGFGTALADAKPVNLEGLSPETLKAIEDAHASVMGRLPEGAPRRGAPVGDRSADLAEAVRSAEAGKRPATETAGGNAPSIGSSVFTPSGREVGVRYRVVEADAPTASHTGDLQPNPAYPSELQPRDRGRAASETQVNRIATELQPARLGASTSAMEGAPIIGPDGLVESGNGRVLAIRKAYAAGGDKSAEYRQFLADQGHDVSGFKRPMLVRERTSDLSPSDRVRFAQEANASAGLASSASERAATDAGRISPDVLAQYQGGDVASAANRPFVRDFLRTVADKGEEGAFATRDGALSMEGAQRVRNAMLHAGYGDTGIVSALAESGDEGLRAFGNVLSGASGKMAQLRQGVVSGAVDGGADLTPHVLEAARFVQTARNRGMPLSMAAAQQDAFSQLSPEAMAILKQGYGDDLSGRLAGAHLSSYLSRAADEAAQQTTGARLFGEPLSARDILSRGRDTSSGAHPADAPAVGVAPALPAAAPATQGRASVLDAAPKGLTSLSADEAHLVQQELRRRSGELKKSLVGSDRIAAGQTSDIRDRLVGRIDAATGGKFRPAQAQFADDMSVREAFDSGMSGLDRVRSGVKGLEDRPEALRRDFAAMRPEEREAYRQGMRTQIATAMDAARNAARAGEAMTDPGFNRQKLAIIFGDAEAGRLLRAVEDSRRMASTNNLIDSGSKTGQVLLGAKAIGMTGQGEASSGLDNAITVAAMLSGRPEIAAGRLALSGARAGITKSRFAADAGRNRLLGEAGLAAGPAGDAVLNRLQEFLDERALRRLAPGASAARAPVNALMRSSTMVQDKPQR